MSNASATPIFRRILIAVDDTAIAAHAAEIVKTATAWPADLIVIGSHARRGIQRLLQRSVADKVMRHARCPVLVVRSLE